MPLGALPLALPLDAAPDRDWWVGRSGGLAVGPHAVVIALRSEDEALRLGAHLTRVFGPPARDPA